MPTRIDRRRAVRVGGFAPDPMPTALNRGAEYPADEDPYDDFIPPVSAARAAGGAIHTPSPDLELDEERLPVGGQTHHQEWLGVALVRKDLPDPIRQSDFLTRNAHHRLTYTMRSFGHWLQENFYGNKVRPPARRHFSKYGTHNPAPFAVKNRHNARRPQRAAYGDFVPAGPRGR